MTSSVGHVASAMESGGLAWWENLLIVAGALLGFALVGIACHYGIGAPKGKRYWPDPKIEPV